MLLVEHGGTCYNCLKQLQKGYFGKISGLKRTRYLYPVYQFKKICPLSPTTLFQNLFIVY